MLITQSFYMYCTVHNWLSHYLLQLASTDCSFLEPDQVINIPLYSYTLIVVTVRNSSSCSANERENLGTASAWPTEVEFWKGYQIKQYAMQYISACATSGA